MKGHTDGAALFDKAVALYESGGDRLECAQMFEKSAQMLENEGAPQRQSAMAYNRAGMCHFKCGSGTDIESQAFEKARSLMKELPDHNSDPLMAIIRSNLAECCARSGDLLESAKLYRQASVTFSNLMFSELAAGTPGQAFNQYICVEKSLAELYRDMEEYIQAQTCLTRIIELAEKHCDYSPATDEMLCSFYNARGTIRFRMGDYEGEIADCTEAIVRCEQLGSDPMGLAIMYSNRGEAYEMLGRYDDMIVNMRQALDSLEKCESGEEADTMSFRISYSLARGLEKSGRLTEAAKVYGQAADIISRMASGEDVSMHLRAEAACRINRAACLSHCELHLYYDSMKEYNRAAKLLEGLENDNNALARLRTLYLSRSELFEAFDELEAAKADYIRAENIAKLIGQKDAEPPTEAPEQA